MHNKYIVGLLVLCFGSVASYVVLKELNYTVPCEYMGKTKECHIQVDVKNPKRRLEPTEPIPTGPTPNTTLPNSTTWTFPTAPGQQCDLPIKRLHANDTHQVYAAYYN